MCGAVVGANGVFVPSVAFQFDVLRLVVLAGPAAVNQVVCSRRAMCQPTPIRAICTLRNGREAGKQRGREAETLRAVLGIVGCAATLLDAHEHLRHKVRTQGLFRSV